MSSRLVSFIIFFLFAIASPALSDDNAGQDASAPKNNNELNISPTSMLHSYKPEMNETDNNLGLKPCSPNQEISSKTADTTDKRIKITTDKTMELNHGAVKYTSSSPKQSFSGNNKNNVIRVTKPPDLNNYDINFP